MQRSNRPNSFNKKQPVEDLRLKLNRKREEKNLSDGPENNLPPPDPSFNFLKDPLRGDNWNRNDKKYNPKFRRSFHDNRRDAGGEERKNSKKDENYKPDTIPMPNKKSVQIQENKTINGAKEVLIKKDLQIQQSSNIKIQVSNSTGERKCTVDETKLVEVPQVEETEQKPNRKPQREAQQYYVSKGKQRSRSFNDNRTESNYNDKKEESKEGNYKKRYANREYKKKEVTQWKENKREVAREGPKTENCDGI